MTMKTKKTLQHIAAVAVVLLTLCLVFAAPVSADVITVSYDSMKSATDNGKTFHNAVKGAVTGDTIVLPEGEYYLTNGDTCRITTDKTLTIVGAGAGKTIITGERYGLVIDNTNPESESVITLKNFTLRAPGSVLYIKSYANVSVEDVVVDNQDTNAILLDSASINYGLGDAASSNVDTVVTVKNVLINTGGKINFVATPCTSCPGVIVPSYTHFYILEGCNFDKGNCFPQDNLNLGGDNLFVNDEILNPASVKVGEEGYSTLEAAVNAATTGCRCFGISESSSPTRSYCS